MEKGFEEHRSVRWIKNRYIILSEQAGFRDFNDFIEYILEALEKSHSQSNNQSNNDMYKKRLYAIQNILDKKGIIISESEIESEIKNIKV